MVWVHSPRGFTVNLTKKVTKPQPFLHVRPEKTKDECFDLYHWSLGGDIAVEFSINSGEKVMNWLWRFYSCSVWTNMSVWVVLSVLSTSHSVQITSFKTAVFQMKKKKKREKKQQSNSSSSVLVFERRRLQTGVQVRSECNCVWSHCERREDVPWWRRQIFKHTCTFSTCAFHTARRERSSEPQVEPQLLSSRSSLGRNLYCCCLIWASFLLASSSSLSFLSISSWAAMIWTDTHVLVQQKITEEINHFRV